MEFWELLPIREMQEFRQECMKLDIEACSKEFHLPDPARILGMTVSIVATYKKSRLTPEEVAGIERMVNAARKAQGLE